MTNIQELSKKIDQTQWDSTDKIIWEKLFPESNDYKLIQENTFELGLVLGGTVSAGAYTAGVLDYLIEALDSWELAKKQDCKAPDWKILIKAISGTSGGGVLATTLGKALSWEFPHVSSTTKVAQPLNPFYHVWVESLDINDFLSTTDLEIKGGIKSLLNSDCRYKAGKYVASFPPTPLVEKHRDYVTDPLPVFLTLTNLKGIPYKVDWGTNMSQSYVSHIDYARFAIFTKNGNSTLREDEFGVSFQPLNGYLKWDDVAKFALGTSAFPVGLPLETLSRPISHYLYRPIIISGDNTQINQTKIVPPNIDWEYLKNKDNNDIDLTYHFVAADGGIINNEPIELCRRELAGILGRNPRAGNVAKRALILVDPFFDSPKLGGESFSNILSGFGDVFNGLKDQARYDSQDLILAGDVNCYSRFMITAKRGNILGGKAIATASLGAFGGFLCKEYREHDYFLGRKNCKEFLSNVENLWFPETNSLFAGWTNNNPDLANKLKQRNSQGEYCLPLIPLYGSALNEQTVPAFPKNAFVPDNTAFQSLLEARVDRLLEKAKDELTSGFISQTFVQIGLDFGGKSKLIEAINIQIKKGLKNWDLI